jgi:hypothetical protein
LIENHLGDLVSRTSGALQRFVLVLKFDEKLHFLVEDLHLKVNLLVKIRISAHFYQLYDINIILNATLQIINLVFHFLFLNL